MTVLVAGMTLLLAIALGAGAVRVGGAASAGARAQLAADAAALAAVAESVPSGGGDPVEAAADYAEANGAKLVECYCDEGASTMQVRVSVDGVAGEARAFFDAALLAPATVGSAIGLQPSLAAAVTRLTAASAGRVWLESGFRTRAQQAALWAEALDRYGSAEAADDWVAPPGHSMHEEGLAVDLGGDLAEALRLIEELDLPLFRPLANEEWHFELSGSRGGPE